VRQRCITASLRSACPLVAREARYSSLVSLVHCPVPTAKLAALARRAHAALAGKTKHFGQGNKAIGDYELLGLCARPFRAGHTWMEGVFLLHRTKKTGEEKLRSPFNVASYCSSYNVIAVLERRIKISSDIFVCQAGSC